ncbi:MAG: 16S rRNA (adenine(1518)-N(6)/adenine(1519)-N(6))-dimethyltransferase RsmA [Candidatus Nomurabacteria bacterium]|jgi:16S rRNA (adenine1518-N6/adenine1519-N6)-dimethyltransferase|nr:16S rRNA (adenine(1518)-N(6)/adenine(1519)-N(6))-dimethyltransferase RsmA [Candidatus Nomurabacteria bacterium]
MSVRAQTSPGKTTPKPDKSLGQHWLRDEAVLSAIADCAEVVSGDTVLEIGPGLGTLTRVLAARAGRVLAVEFDPDLAARLSREFAESKSVEIIPGDFLRFDLSRLPAGYKVAANIPYYITNPIIMQLLSARNKPCVAALLVQREVAERLAAKPGAMSILAVAAQFHAEVSLGPVVPARLFTPPPKVDSQVVILRPRPSGRDLSPDQEKLFFRIVKAGFSARRKKLRTALSGGLNTPVAEAEILLHTAGINPNLRAQDLTIEDWCEIMQSFDNIVG